MSPDIDGLRDGLRRDLRVVFGLLLVDQPEPVAQRPNGFQIEPRHDVDSLGCGVQLDRAEGRPCRAFDTLRELTLLDAAAHHRAQRREGPAAHDLLGAPARNIVSLEIDASEIVQARLLQRLFGHLREARQRGTIHGVRFTSERAFNPGPFEVAGLPGRFRHDPPTPSVTRTARSPSPKLAGSMLIRQAGSSLSR
jgi:hypothetical protein